MNDYLFTFWRFYAEQLEAHCNDTLDMYCADHGIWTLFAVPGIESDQSGTLNDPEQVDQRVSRAIGKPYIEFPPEEDFSEEFRARHFATCVEAGIENGKKDLQKTFEAAQANSNQ